MTATQYRFAGAIGVGAFALAVIALHVLDPDLGVVDEYISAYGLGDYGWLMRAADFLLGLGVLAIGLALRSTLAEGKRVTASWMLFLIAGLGFILSGVFSTDPANTVESTAAGAFHDAGGYISILSLMFATWFLRGVFKRDPNHSRLYKFQTWFAILMTGTLAAFIAFEPILGLTQRVFVAVVVTWLIALAINLKPETTSIQALDEART